MSPDVVRAFESVSENLVLVPMLKMYPESGFVFPTAAEPFDTNDIPEFVNRIVFDTVFPVFTTCSRVPVNVEKTSVMLVIRPSASTVMTGFLPPAP